MSLTKEKIKKVWYIYAMEYCVWALSSVRLFVTPWTAARQAPLSMRFSRQEYWTGLPCPPPGDLLNPGVESMSLLPPALAGGSFIIEPPGKTHMEYYSAIKRNEIGSFVETSMGAETVIHRESKSEKPIWFINPYMWNLEKNGTDDLVCTAEIETKI